MSIQIWILIFLFSFQINPCQRQVVVCTLLTIYLTQISDTEELSVTSRITRLVIFSQEWYLKSDTRCISLDSQRSLFPLGCTVGVEDECQEILVFSHWEVIASPLCPILPLLLNHLHWLHVRI